MSNKTFFIPDPGEHLTFTGERYTTGVHGDIQNEHYHRYLFALQLCEGRDVLDVASGEGYGAALIATIARSVVGVDIDDASVAFAAQGYVRENLTFRVGSALAIPLDDASIDVVVSFETLEHVVDGKVFLQEVKRVLRPGGLFIVSTPDKKVYSEEPGYHNPFHLNELYREEFWDLLTVHFPHVQMFEQQVIAGSVLSVVENMTAGGTESFSTIDGHAFKHRSSLPNAPYIVAVASPEPTTLPSVSILHGLSTDAAAASRPQAPPVVSLSSVATGTGAELMALHMEIGDIRAQLIDANLEAARIKQQLLEMDHERGFLRAMLSGARRLADQTRAELVHARSMELARVAEVAEIRENMEEQIETIRRSTSWRVTRPLRGAKTLARRILR